jgi:hypothetical protein
MSAFHTTSWGLTINLDKISAISEFLGDHFIIIVDGGELKIYDHYRNNNTSSNIKIWTESVKRKELYNAWRNHFLTIDQKVTEALLDDTNNGTN